jgi:hypothetical protein
VTILEKETFDHEKMLQNEPFGDPRYNETSPRSSFTFAFLRTPPKYGEHLPVQREREVLQCVL